MSLTNTLNNIFSDLNEWQIQDIEENYNEINKFIKTLKYTYLPHQEIGIKWLIYQSFYSNILGKNVKGGLLCDDPGLGKTLQILSILKVLENCNKFVNGRVLIIVPLALLEQWRNEANKFFPNNVKVNHGLAKMIYNSDVATNNKLIVITSYNNLYNSEDKKFKPSVLHSVTWDAIVCDEVHIIKNKSSLASQGCQTIKAKYRFGLTGTPVQNKIDDIKSLFLFLGINKKKIMNTILFEEFMIPGNIIFRRNKDVFNLPEYNNLEEHQKYKNISIDIHPVAFKTDEEREFYHKLRDEIKKAYIKLVSEEEGNNIMSHVFELLIRLRQATIHPSLVYNGLIRKTQNDKDLEEDDKKNILDKLKKRNRLWNTRESSKITELVELFQNHEPDDKSLIITHFEDEAKKIGDALNNNFPHLNIEIYDGTKDISSRNQILKDCIKGKVDVLILQIKTGGVGLNLQMFNLIYNLSPDWNPSNEIQAFARAYRIGQKKDVKVVKLILHEEGEKATIDERLLAIQEKKRDLMAIVLNDDTLKFNENVIGKDIASLTKKDFSMLFR